MPYARGVSLQKGESLSLRYPGYIEKADGTFRKSFEWKNKSGAERSVNRYYQLVNCFVCSSSFLADKSNIKTQKKFYCSDSCRTIGLSAPDGSQKMKRGRNPDSHVLVKQADHPFARKGWVPEHRLVMEKSIGRFLLATEIVHHINLVKPDNREENLVICDSPTQHNLVHGSLNKCVAELITLGVLRFNRETMTYQVIEGVKS